GTAQRANFAEYPMAGKTGTAQAWAIVNGQRVKDNRALFTGYGPYDNPRYAITVVVEGGTSGGRDTGPVVKQIFKKIAELEKGASIDMAYLTPALGHFHGVQAINPEDELLEDQPPPEEFIPPTEFVPEPRRKRSFWDRLFNRNR
ncbi:MAG: penicillin-binding transpeptidase domain-containing protein, partial [Verrucomicrobiota bacterium]